MTGTAPPRGFPRDEFTRRLDTAQLAMRDARFDALLLTTEPNVRYFSGFFTQFWESPTRPWFLLLPADGMPIAVIPEIGHAGMANTWVEDIRTWPSPRPEDDGISLLSDCIARLPRRFGRLGMMLGAESMLRMPAADFAALREKLRGIEIADAARLIQDMRMLKSEREIGKMRHICGIAAQSFDALPGFARAGMSEIEICRRMRIDLLERGADASPYLIAASGRGGYDNIVMGPGERRLEHGDLLIIDTGSTWDGYFCDFDRNFAFGEADAAARAAYDCAWRATEAGLRAARAGATTSDLWSAMNRVLGEGGSLGNAVGRLGHGLGMQLTERPSNTADDATPLRPGMVVTLEPGMEFAPGRHMVHEENIVITEDRAELLSRRAAPELPVLAE